MKKVLFLLTLSFCSLLSIANPISQKPFIDTYEVNQINDLNESVLILNIDIDGHVFKFKVYGKEVINEDKICLYGKSPYKNLNKIVVDKETVNIIVGDKVIKAHNNQLYYNIVDHIHEIPNIVIK